MGEEQSTQIRRWKRDERDAWERLFRAYVFDFYKMSVTDETVDATWQRLLDEQDAEVQGLGAFNASGTAVGLVHYLPQSTCWDTRRICYLEDLFVLPECRGEHVGRALVEAVYAEARKNGWAKVFWETQEFNHLGRILYDELAVKSDFIVYEKEID